MVVVPVGEVWVVKYMVLAAAGGISSPSSRSTQDGSPELLTV